MKVDPLALVNTANCDTCRDPGHCCKSFQLNTLVPKDMTADQLRVHIRDGLDPMTGLGQYEEKPFEPEYVSQKETAVPDTVLWAFTCPKLLPSGRCGIYETRPQLCRDFEPGSDALCIEWPGHGEPEE